MRRLDSEGNDVLHQGDTYEEADADTGKRTEPADDGEVLSGSEEEDEQPKKGSSLLGNIPSVYLLVGVIGFIIVLLLGVVFFVMVSGNKKEEDVQETIVDTITGNILDAEGNVIELAPFEYTDEEREALRIAGFTGDEIEDFERKELSAEDKVAEVEKKRKEQYEKEIAPYLDGASEEFNWLKNNTWVGQDPLEYSKDSSQYTQHSVKQNFDFEKIPPYGNQLWIKLINVNTGKAVFMSVDPKTYDRLKASGNIVVEMTYINTGKGSPNIIIGLKEVNVAGD